MQRAACLRHVSLPASSSHRFSPIKRSHNVNSRRRTARYVPDYESACSDPAAQLANRPAPGLRSGALTIQWWRELDKMRVTSLDLAGSDSWLFRRRPCCSTGFPLPTDSSGCFAHHEVEEHCIKRAGWPAARAWWSIVGTCHAATRLGRWRWPEGGGLACTPTTAWCQPAMGTLHAPQSCLWNIVHRHI